MKWIQASFRGQRIWAALGEDGRPLVEGGRRVIRYSDAPGAKLYRAGASGVEDEAGGPLDLPDGVSADAPRPSARGSGFGSAGSRTAAQADAALQDARARMESLPEGTAVAFTDGACAGNPGPAGAGAVVRLPDGRRVERYEALGEATNNVGELVAIGMALAVLRESGLPNTTPVVVFTDSQYALGVLSKGWKPKANVALIAGLKRRLAEWPEATLSWVAGHVGVEDNERADQLAAQGVRESRGR